MIEYITQEKALALLRVNQAAYNYLDTGTELAQLCNAAIQDYKDSQPKPANVERSLRDLEYVGDEIGPGLERDYLDEAINLIEQQAEALAQAQEEIERLKYEVDAIRAIPAIKDERDQLRAKLAVLQAAQKEDR